MARNEYGEAVRYLNSLIDFEKLGALYFGRDRFQLRTMRTLLAELGNPEANLRIVHIAGTKGKGSTAAMLDSVLRAAGLSVGLFTQPHLVDIRERTRINGRLIGKAPFARAVRRVQPYVDKLNAQTTTDPVTFYEAHLAVAVSAFAERRVDIAVIETGLGGRLDASNVLSPVATAITRIDYDHTEILGHTLEQIAREKAGILKPGVPCVFSPQVPKVMRVLKTEAQKAGARTVECPRVAEHPDGTFDVIAGRRYTRLRLSLRGRHQLENAAVAVALVEMLEASGVPIGDDAVRRGLAKVRWPGRFQVLPSDPMIVLDVAHNPVSARVLSEALAEVLASRRGSPRLLMVVGMAKDKDLAGFLRALAPLAWSVVCTRAASPRAAEPETLASAAGDFAGRVLCEPTVSSALAAVHAIARPEDVICITGSFHVVGEAMQVLGVKP